MFYHTPGGNLGTDLTGTQTISDVTLTNTQLIYWPGTDVSTSNAWRFDFSNGIQDNRVKGGNLQFGWTVADGVVFVPIPPAIWLFGSGLLGLVGVARKKAPNNHNARLAPYGCSSIQSRASFWAAAIWPGVIS